MLARFLNLSAFALVILGSIAPQPAAAQGPVPGAAQAAAPAAPPCSISALIPDPSALPADEMPVRYTLTYSMTGRARPLLFWISKDGVGSAKIVWHTDGKGANALELFVGTDPANVPRKIDRWGYIVERAHPESDTRVTGLITAAQESSIADVQKAQDANQSRIAFKSIETAVEKTAACVATSHFETFYDPLNRQIPTVVRQARANLVKAEPKASWLPPDVRAGFFTAMWEMLQAAVAARQNGPSGLAKVKGRKVPYVYGTGVLELTLVDVHFEPSPIVPIPPEQRPMHAEFQLLSRTTGEKYKFELQFGTVGHMAGVPVLIRYSPRWWLQVDLKLATIDPPATPDAK